MLRNCPAYYVEPNLATSLAETEALVQYIHAQQVGFVVLSISPVMIIAIFPLEIFGTSSDNFFFFEKMKIEKISYNLN